MATAIMTIGAGPAFAVQATNVAVSKVTPTNAVLVVKTDVSSNVTVDYGTAPGVHPSSGSSSSLLRHEIPLTGLAPSAAAYYTVTITSASDGTDTIVLPEKSFQTTKSSGVPFSYAVGGDNRPPWTDPIQQPAVWSTIVDQMKLENIDLMVHLGDIIYGSASETVAQNEHKYDVFFAITQSLTDEVPMYTAVGNHEWIHFPNPRAAYENQFTLPENNGLDAATDGEMYYSFDHGDTHFIALNSELDGSIGMILGNQKTWLEHDLAAANKEWIVVNIHRPFHSDAHPTDPWIDTTNTLGQQNKAELHALFKQHGVDVVFAGHDHFYLHHVEEGIQYVVSGAMGSPLYALPLMGPGDIFGVSTYHHTKVDETADSMTLTAIDSAGIAHESFTLGVPNLTISQVNTYWASYDDYIQGLLSVDYSMNNNGPGDTTGLDVVYLTSTNGVLPITGTPINLGAVPAGQNVPVTAQYLIPPGVAFFRATTYVTCQDWGANSYSYPGPAPAF